MRHVNYLKYLLRHKYFVFKAIVAIEGKCAVTTALAHDMSKFSPTEWFPYAETFYTEDGSNQYCESDKFYFAWNSHQKQNKHHWQYWVLIEDCGVVRPLKMPTKFVNEMISDWLGAGMAITGKWEVKEWYELNKERMVLHPETREQVENFLTYNLPAVLKKLCR